METNTEELPEAITNILFAGLVPFITSSPGLGKSTIVAQVADDLNLQMIDIRLSQLDSADLSGFPTIVNGKTSFIPPDLFPLDTDPLPKGKEGWLCFFDEANAASPSTQVAAYKILLDRKVGQYNLHKNVAMVAAGNNITDKAIVNRLSTAMQSRLIHLNLVVRPKDWVNWANENKLDHRVVSFIEFRPDLLHSFNPDHKDNTYACPRTWSFTNKLVKDKSVIDPLLTKIIAGTVGEGAGREFKAFTDICESLPTIKTIEQDPLGTSISSAPDVRFAITGLIANSINKANAKALVQFVERLPLEFQIITWISAIKRNKEVYELPQIKEWITKHAKDVQF